MQYNKKSVEYIATDLSLITRKHAIYDYMLLHARPRIRRALFKQKIALSKFYANILQAYASIYKPERGRTYEYVFICSFFKTYKNFLNFFQKTIDKLLGLWYNKYRKRGKEQWLQIKQWKTEQQEYKTLTL